MSNYLDEWKVDWPEERSGPWAIERFTINQSTELLYYTIKGRSIPPGTYTRLHHDTRGVVMSDTPAECRDMLKAVHRAKGNVLVNGLGLGVYVKAIANKPEVTSIDIVEKDYNIITLISKHLHNRYNKPINIFLDDALTHLWAKGKKWDYAWHDIWDSICTDNLIEMTKLHRRYGNRVAAQDSWCKEICKRNKAKNL